MNRSPVMDEHIDVKVKQSRRLVDCTLNNDDITCLYLPSECKLMSPTLPPFAAIRC